MKKIYLLVLVLNTSVLIRAQTGISLPYSQDFSTTAGVAGWLVDGSTPNWYLDTAAPLIYVVDTITPNIERKLFTPWLNATTVAHPTLKFSLRITDHSTACVPKLYFMYQVGTTGIETVWNDYSPAPNCSPSNNTVSEGLWTDITVGLPGGSSTYVRYIFSAYFRGEGKVEIKNVRLGDAATLGINEIASNGLTVYPNPSSGNFTVNFEADQSENVQIKIVNVMGRVIKEKSIVVVNGIYSEEINLSDVAKGVYIIQIKSDEAILTKRIEMQ